MTHSPSHHNEQTSSGEDGFAPLSSGKRRPAWHRPTVALIDIRRTMNNPGGPYLDFLVLTTVS